MKCFRATLTLLACGVLTGCFGGHSAAPDLYVLKAEAPPIAACRSSAVVQVPLPDATLGLEGQRIAVFDSPDHLNYYTGARWAAPVPEMVQSFLADTLARSQAFKAVSLGNDGARSDLRVKVSIQDFEVEGVSRPAVHVYLMVTVINVRTGNVIKTLPLETTVAPPKNRMASIVGTFNAAMNEAAAQILDETINAAPRCR